MAVAEERQERAIYALAPLASTSKPPNAFPSAEPPSRLSRSQPVSTSFSFAPPRAASAAPPLTGSWRLPFPHRARAAESPYRSFGR